jgi:hypothetical protein
MFPERFAAGQNGFTRNPKRPPTEAALLIRQLANFAGLHLEQGNFLRL